MWKKIGAVGPSSNDNKSSRSKDQNAYQPFSQMSKIRMTESQMVFEQNQYFCPSYLSKKKGLQGKCLSQSKIQTSAELQHVKSYKQISTDYKQGSIKKKTFNQNQMEDLRNRLSRQLIQEMNDSGQKEPKKNCGEDHLRETQSTEMICSQTSIQNDMRKLKQCRSTPQLNFAQIPSITEQISLDTKIETQKNLKSLKKQHAQIKVTVKKELNEFKKDFNIMQAQIKNKISTVMQESLRQSKQSSSSYNDQKMKQQLTNKSLNYAEIESETKKFGDSLKRLNQKKADMLNKYMSFRAK